jgi:DNA gyrase subunit A
MADDELELEVGADDDGEGDVAVEHVAWDGETIDAADALLERALSYGMYVNKGRALPDVRDGLKPVQRRIITAMDEIGARAGRPYMKSAQVIGEVIGNYHPHGDAPIYDAMVRLAQSFSLNVPLVDGQGNWGSVGPKEYSDPAAAYRYTEARLTAAATDWLADLRPQIVEYRPNFTEKRDEPFVLPVTFPNLLVNGSRGIGWSMACEVPPHNLVEACEAAIALAENPDAALADLLDAMPGPDFPTGGIVVDPEGLAEAYERGSGTFRLQAKFHVEQLPGNLQAVVVTELPFGVSPDQIVAEVVRAARAERITDVTELPKNLSDRSGIRVQIRCKRGGNVTKLIADLMRLTSLRITVGINMTVLVDGAPRQLGLRDALDAFVTFRFEVVTRRLEHERSELLRELRRLVALLAALDAIDRVVQIIRGAEDDDDAREKLKLELKVRHHGSASLQPIDDEQAQQILDMPLKRLTRLNKLRLQEEVDKKGARVDEIGRILDSFDELRGIVVGELRDVARRYGAPRRTVLGGESRLAPAAADGGASGTSQRVRDLAVVAAPRTDVLLFATASGACATRPREARLPRVPLNVGASDAVVCAVATDTESELNAFSSDGQVYRLRVADVPIEGRISRGVKAVGLERGASLAALCPVEPAEGFLLLVTAGGEIKRSEAGVFATSHLGGSPAIDLPSGDALVAVVPHAEGDDLLLHSAAGKTLRIEAARLRPVKSPAAGGVAGMRLDPGDRVIAAGAARGDVLLVVHERGHGKAVALADYPRKGRGTGGVQSAAIDGPRRDPAGPVAGALALAAGEAAYVLSAAGSLARVVASELEPLGRATVSRGLADVAAGDRISAVVPAA